MYSRWWWKGDPGTEYLSGGWSVGRSTGIYFKNNLGLRAEGPGPGGPVIERFEDRTGYADPYSEYLGTFGALFVVE